MIFYRYEKLFFDIWYPDDILYPFDNINVLPLQYRSHLVIKSLFMDYDGLNALVNFHRETDLWKVLIYSLFLLSNCFNSTHFFFPLSNNYND